MFRKLISQFICKHDYYWVDIEDAHSEYVDIPDPRQVQEVCAICGKRGKIIFKSIIEKRKPKSFPFSQKVWETHMKYEQSVAKLKDTINNYKQNKKDE